MKKAIENSDVLKIQEFMGYKLVCINPNSKKESNRFYQFQQFDQRGSFLQSHVPSWYTEGMCDIGKDDVMEYNDDWNLIMIVIDKIELMGGRFSGKMGKQLYSTKLKFKYSLDAPESYKNSVEFLSLDEDKKYSYLMTIVKFIDWYNLNKPKLWS